MYVDKLYVYVENINDGIEVGYFYVLFLICSYLKIRYEDMYINI